MISKGIRFVILLAALCCVSFAGNLNAGNIMPMGAAIIEKPGVKITYEVGLSSEMIRAVSIRHSDFRMWSHVNFDAKVLARYEYNTRQSPSAVFGDFNSDGIIDAVLFGHNNVRLEIIAVVSDSGKSSTHTGDHQYKVVDIWMSEREKVTDDMRGIRAILTSHAKGEIIKSESNLPDACNKTLKNDAFGVRNLDIDGIETLFPCEEYLVLSCIIRM